MITNNLIIAPIALNNYTCHVKSKIGRLSKLNRYFFHKGQKSRS